MKRIVFQGDSITDAGRNREHPDSTTGMGCGYPLLLKARLNYDHPGCYECMNLGVSGDRVVDVYARIKKDLIGLAPDYLSLLIGVNDVWHELSDRPNGVSADKFERVYDWLIGEVKEALPKIRILILEPFVLPASATVSDAQPERWESFSREVPLRAEAAKRIAEKHGARFVPLQAKFDEMAKLMPPSYWLRDGVHPTEAGHELIAREWIKAFGELC